MSRSINSSFLLSLPFLLLGFIWSNPFWIDFGSVVFGTFYFYIELRRKKFQGIDPIWLFALSMSITSFSNMIGTQSIGARNESVYFLYADKNYLFEASLIQYLGFVSIALGFIISRKCDWLPRISYELRSTQTLNRLFLINLIFIWAIFQGTISGFLGTIQSFIINIPLFSAFLLARIGASFKIRKYLYFGLFIVVLLTWHAVLYSYLRSEMIKPSMFFLLGYLLGSKSIYVLFNWRFIPIYIFVLIFNNYFAFFGSERANIGIGQRRIESIMDLGQEEMVEINIKGETPLSRATNFNQLSQVARLADQRGFYSGSTLDYMTYAFIPRFLWPEKPLIQIGAWFASEIGLGWKDSEGRYHNSINMTVPGEFYLNFGFIGVIFGCLVFGFLFGVFWNSINFWNSDTDLLGNLFGSYLLFLGFFTIGADLQIMVTITAIYLLFLFTNRFLLKNA